MTAKIKSGMGKVIEQIQERLKAENDIRKCDPAQGLPKPIEHTKFQKWVEPQLQSFEEPKQIFRLRNWEDIHQKITENEQQDLNFNIEDTRWEQKVAYGSDSDSCLIYYGRDSDNLIYCSDSSYHSDGSLECSDNNLTDEEIDFDALMKKTTEIFASSVNPKINRSKSF